jgi:hypothetical protein
MPYRRLPNTNQARLRSMQNAVRMGEIRDLYDLAFSYKTLEDVKTFLVRYERALVQYKQSIESQTSTNKKHQQLIRNARLYISHFIQVLNMCVTRNEIKAEHKELYGLEIDNFTVPDLSSEENLFFWGKKIIGGESQRIVAGGAPIYNPAIAKVRVHYDIFVESYNNQKILQNNTSRAINNISRLNEVADSLIIEIWDQVESYYSKLDQEKRMENCQEYGIIYYYRKEEKKQICKNEIK